MREEQPSQFDLELLQRMVEITETLQQLSARVTRLEPQPKSLSLSERIDKAVAIIAPNYPEMTEEEERLVDFLWKYEERADE